MALNRQYPKGGLLKKYFFTFYLVFS